MINFSELSTNDQFAQLVNGWVLLYKNDKTVCRLNSFSNILNEAYYWCIKSGTIVPIENIEPELKIKYWSVSFQYKTVLNERKKLCRALYFADEFLKDY